MSKMADSKDSVWNQCERNVKQEDSENYLMEDASVSDAIKNYATGNLLSPSKSSSTVPTAAHSSSGYNVIIFFFFYFFLWIKCITLNAVRYKYSLKYVFSPPFASYIF